MELFEEEPGTLPKLQTLRKAKSDLLIKQRIYADPITAIDILKHSKTHNSSIAEIGHDPFFIHYTPEQFKIYNAYVQKAYSRIIIDATGNVVENLLRPGGDKSAHIFLYEDVTSLPGETEGQILILQMLSARQREWYYLLVKRMAPLRCHAFQRNYYRLFSCTFRSVSCFC